MGEWDPKPDCFGKLTKGMIEACHTCGHVHECVSITMVANLTEYRHPGAPGQGTSPLIFAGLIKKPTAAEIAKNCRQMYDALKDEGFGNESAFDLMINLIGHF